MKYLCLILLLGPLYLCGQIGDSNFSYNDPARGGRTITGTIYYPATANGTNTPVAAGQFPIIAFGHGFTIGVADYSAWWNGLVPCGYIMIFPDTEGGLAPSHGDFGEDLSFLVNEYLAQNATGGSMFFQKLTGAAGVMGHSMGGGCAFLAADGNPNINTIVTMAAAETNPSAVAAAGNLTIPSLTIAGSLDCVAPPANHQLLMYNAAPTYKAYLEIIDGSHCQFANSPFLCTLAEGTSCGGSAANFISQADQHTQMLASSKPWLDFHLKGDCAALATFDTYLTTSPDHTFMEMGTLNCTACPTITGVTSNVTSDQCDSGAGVSVNYTATTSTGTNGIDYDIIWTVNGTVQVSTADVITVNLSPLDGCTVLSSPTVTAQLFCLSTSTSPNPAVSNGTASFNVYPSPVLGLDYSLTDNACTVSVNDLCGSLVISNNQGGGSSFTIPPGSANAAVTFNISSNSSAPANCQTTANLTASCACLAILNLTGTENGIADNEASDFIESDQVLTATSMVDYDAKNLVLLKSGFSVDLGGVFMAFIDGCNMGAGGVNLKSDTESKQK